MLYMTNERYESARKIYQSIGVDTEAALERLKNVPVSMHCWQGDDVIGFDSRESLSGGIQTTGNYPGRAATPEQLMQDISKVLTLVPGKKKLNLHASYAMTVQTGIQLNQNILPDGLNLLRNTIWELILIQHFSHIEWLKMDLHYPHQMKK